MPKKQIHPSACIHPTAIIEDDVSIGPETSVWDNVHIRKNTVIGENSIIGEKTYIAYDVKIGDGVKINSFVYICTGVTIEDHGMVAAGTVFTNDRFPRAFDSDGTVKTSEPTEETLQTTVRRGTTIGSGCIIGPGIELGEYAMIGMGSVVTKDVLPYQLVYGNPARPHGFVCVCGEQITSAYSASETPEKDLTCSKCNRRYEFFLEGIRPKV